MSEKRTVNLTYSCDLDEVPYEAGRLVEDICIKLTDVVETLKESSTHLLTADEELRFGDAYSAIVNAKDKMEKFDERLAAVLAILSGFYSAMTKPAQDEQLENQPETQTTSEISEKLSQIESQLESVAEQVMVEEDDDDDD
tara:strand:- start:291 stop:713 length:423 start_codon:yes stop_codon:yes gene_type:complete